jgi:hypothetical protein
MTDIGVGSSEPETVEPAPEESQGKSKRQVVPRLVIAGVVAVILIVAGPIIAWQVTASNMQPEIDSANAQLHTSQGQVAALKGNNQMLQDAAAKQTADLTAREAAVTAREAAVKQIETVIQASQFSDGMHVVGTDVQPGTYSIASSTNCYYVFKDGTGSGAKILDNDIVSGPVTLTLKSGDVLETNRCGVWTKR